MEKESKKNKIREKKGEKRDHCLESRLKRFPAYFPSLRRRFALARSTSAETGNAARMVRVESGRRAPSSMVHKLEFDAGTRLRAEDSPALILIQMGHNSLHFFSASIGYLVGPQFPDGILKLLQHFTATLTFSPFYRQVLGRYTSSTLILTRYSFAFSAPAS